jgi:hypothetical protein
MRLARLLVLAAIAIAGCQKFDRLLEGTDVYDGTLAVGVSSPNVTIAQGRQFAFTTTVTQTGQLRDAITISVEGAPIGLTATVSDAATSGQRTTATVTLVAGASVTVGNYLLTIRARSGPQVNAATILPITITQAPAFTLNVSSNTLRIARGGIAPLGVKLQRTNLSTPIALALSGTGGISASFGANPIAGDSTSGTISVPAATAPGTYTVSLRATTDSVGERTAQLTVIVTADPLQVIVGERLTTAQGSTVAIPVIVNHPGSGGAITLTADNLPPGASATFDPSMPTGSMATMSLQVSPATPPGVYVVSVRGSATGLGETSTTLELNVTAVSIALSVAPREISVFQGGAAATSSLRLTRTGYVGAVTLAFENAPAGLSIVAQPPALTADSGSVVLQASSLTQPGQYDVTIRATPSGFPATTSSTAIIAVTVRSAPPGGGNVTLDWSRCAEPDWVAYQDGTAAWAQAPVASGVARFQISSARGAIAYVEAGSTVTARFGLQAEFTAKPLDMCPVVQGNKSVSGSVSLNSTVDQMAFRLGGGSASATGVASAFTIGGIDPGTHDLIGWGQLGVFGRRGIIRRDLNLPSGSSLGTLDPLGIESFVPVTASLAAGGIAVGEQTAHSMSYLTTEACTPNLLYQATGTAMLGVPTGIQRPTDYHMVNLSATLGSRQRTATMTFKTLANATLALPPIPPTPNVVAAANAPYRRLSALFGSLSAIYNGSVTLRYNDGSSRTMTVIASAAYLAGTTIQVAMPLFSGVSGWRDSYAVDAAATGTWVATLDGATPGPTCSEGKISYLATQSGRY